MAQDLPSVDFKRVKDLDDDQYSKVLDVYVNEVKKQEQMEKERHRMYLMEKSFTYSWFDIIFPYHMYLGKYDAQKKGRSAESNEKQLTTIKTYNRRRMYLIWLYYDKFDQILTPEERDVRDYAEHTVFKYNFGFKALSLGLLLTTIFRQRKLKHNYYLDLVLLYSTCYSFLLSYIVGVHLAWPHYEKVAKKMIKQKMRIDIENDLSYLDDFKVKYYKYDIAISKFF